MVTRALKLAAISAIATMSLFAGQYNQQAEKDRQALIKYFVAKFSDPVKNAARFFPYTPTEELKKNYRPVKDWHEFAKGVYSFAKGPRQQYLELIEMPPYEDDVDDGEELYNSTKGLKECFPKPAEAAVEYPKYDTKKHEVVTLTMAINDCVVKHGGKPWNPYKGKIAKVEAYFAAQARDAGKVINVKIPNAEAEKAYEHGKKYYFSQRGYIDISCANCHVQGAGKRVRRDYLSPLVGQVTHFPVYRLSWEELGTLERRLKGCIKDQGQQPPKPFSEDMRDLIYFLSYMSNGMKVDGPDVRK